jgi:DNA-directed RNA polymerase specialized sigma24 family protein
VTLDQALPLVRKLARQKAEAFVTTHRLAMHEREDIESQLILHFLIRWRNFDSERASVQTFASRLMDRELTSILRYRRAQRRQPCKVVAQSDGSTSTLLHQFRLDVECVMTTLPDVLRETALALRWFSGTDTAGKLGCSRQMISRRKQRIRDALLAAGINNNYFAGGARQ